MAARAQGDVLNLLQAFRDYRDDLRTDIAGFLTNIAAIRTECITDDDVEENNEMLTWCAAAEAACNALWNQQADVEIALGKVLGRYGGSPDLSNHDENLARFNDTLVAAGDEFEKRGLTKFTSWAAGGSNVGNGTAMVHNIDEAYGGDISHVETLTAECVESAPDVDSPVFKCYGEDAGDFAYLEGGSGQGDAYPMPTAAVGKNAPGISQEEVNTGEDIQSVGDEASEGNVLEDGGFEAATFAAATDSNWIDDGSGTTPTVNTTSPVEGLQDCQFSADGGIYQDVSAKVRPGRIYGLEFWTRKNGTVSAGTTVVKLTDQTTDHITISVTNSAASGTEKQAYGTVRIPDNADIENMRVTIVESSIAGGGSMHVDSVKLVELKIIDGGRAIGFTDGTTPWARNDVFTGATTGGTSGTLQRQNNELFRRGFEADTVATNWTD